MATFSYSPFVSFIGHKALDITFKPNEYPLYLDTMTSSSNP